MWTKILISGIIAGLIAGSGSLIAVATELPPGAALGEIGGVTWLVILATALGSAAKDWQALMREPPEKTQ
jgi:hypothetical protein